MLGLSNTSRNTEEIHVFFSFYVCDVCKIKKLFTEREREGCRTVRRKERGERGGSRERGRGRERERG